MTDNADYDLQLAKAYADDARAYRARAHKAKTERSASYWQKQALLAERESWRRLERVKQR
jgi:hypothetical protein